MFQLRLLRFNSVFAVNQISEVIPPWGKSVFDCLISSKFCAKTIIRLTDLLTPFNRTNEIFARCMKTVRELDGKSSRLRSVIISNVFVSTTKRCQCVANHYESIEEHFPMLWETLTNVGIPLKMHWECTENHYQCIESPLTTHWKMVQRSFPLRVVFANRVTYAVNFGSQQYSCIYCAFWRFWKNFNLCQNYVNTQESKG